RPMTVPSQDMIIGAFYLTYSDDAPGEPQRTFKHEWDAIRAYDDGQTELHAPVVIRDERLRNEDGTYVPTTIGRIMFNQTLPASHPFVNDVVKKRSMGTLVRDMSESYPLHEVSDSLDLLKNLCYRFASQSGLTISIDDIATPDEKRTILDHHEDSAQKVEQQFRRGIITDGERRQKEVEIWTTATDEVREAMEASLKAKKFNPIDMMVGSGARGNMMQVRQIAGMRGLVANPRGDMIPRPIKSNFREGLSMLEYFIATPGARKGLVDTALRTADSGYLTRRLVDVAQELIINDEDPFERGSVRGIWLEDIGPDQGDKRTYLETRLFSRCLADDVTLSDGTVFEAGTLIDEDKMIALRDDAEVTRVRVLSPLTEDSNNGVSAKAYGGSLATGKLIEIGEAVGVIAAQSIGEPGTQLTMRTFHTGGVAGSDIAGGLPRVVELFEARTPKGKAILSTTSGTIRIGEDEGRGRVVSVIDDEGGEITYTVPSQTRLAVKDGDQVRAGDPIKDGPRDPKELMEIRGTRETQEYLVDEVQKVYRDQGVSIHDKHIELIVRQMTRRILVAEAGDSPFLPGEQVDAKIYADANRATIQDGGAPAQGRPVIMGITKASLATESWLSAASFQETTRVLTEAAIESKSDRLLGLKENIIIGKLIPAGTGMDEYNDIATTAPDYQPMQYWTSDEEQDPAEWLASIQGPVQGGEVVDLADGAPS
ncbi:MAG: DNA-directed RNA polymerase subunit beta', partial [Actinomycetota bacterium]